jgi:ribose 5-phosphate isomerase B
MMAVGIMRSADLQVRGKRQVYNSGVRVALGADHAGYQLKDALKRVLDELGVTYHDYGTNSPDSVDYPDFAESVARSVADAAFDRGILVCGSGIGMSIAANKVSGIRAAVASDTEAARLARQHNDANVVAIGARLTPADRAAEIVRAFLSTAFEGGRHEKRLEKIARLEQS